MNQQQDHDARIQVTNLEARNNEIHSGTTRASKNSVSDKFQQWFYHPIAISDFGFIKEILDPHELFLQRWYETFFFMCVIALALDPLFCYSLVINDSKKCLKVDQKLGTIAIVLRSVMDFLYVIHVIFEFLHGLSLPRVFGRAVKSAWAMEKRNSFSYFLIDVLSVLPLPQVVGAFWYLFAVGRKTICWQEACKRHIGCVRLSCDDILGDYIFLTDSCPIKTPNATTFNFGIFLEALDSGIVDSTDFLQKFSYSFWFGLQSLSSLGQGLKTSTYFWEIFFAVIISIFGLVLFAFLIGNMQTYLQSKTARLEEMRLKGHDIDLWLAYHSLPSDLKQRIKNYQRYKYQETRGVDVENLLHNLPRDIRRDTKRHLCLNVIKKVPILQKAGEPVLDAICDHLKLVFYIKNSCVVREGAPLDDMLFITQGTLLLYGNGGRSFLKKGNFYGEELLTWALSYSPTLNNIPFSAKTIHTHTKVEAFALTANDLKSIVSKFMSRIGKELCSSPSLELEKVLMNRAAAAVQEAWRSHHSKKLAASGGKKLESLSTTCVSIFVANAPTTIQGAHEAQQPAVHDITAEQP